MLNSFMRRRSNFGRIARTGVAIVGAALLTACATYKGASEFAAYRTAYTAASTAGAEVLDELAVAERELFATAFPFDPARTEFDPATALYILEIGDPPMTAAYRRAQSAVTVYNEALHGLSSGADAEALIGRVTRLSALGASAASELSALGAAPTAGGSVAVIAAANTVNTAVAALQPLLREFANIAFQAEFRSRLLDQAPKIRAALLESRTSTTRIFNALRDNIVTKAQADATRFGDLNEKEIADITRLRFLMANWVVLIDASLASLDTAVEAVERTGEGRFEGLLASGDRLLQAAGAARRNLRGGG